LSLIEFEKILVIVSLYQTIIIIIRV